MARTISKDPLVDEMAQENLTRDILEALSEPFPEDAIEWKPQAFSQDRTRALAVPYITSRHIMDRLDEAVGPANWEYWPNELRRGIRGELTIFGVTKCDIGFIEGDNDAAIKGSSSDALKRAAVLFGIGRYLYSTDANWYGWDDRKKQFTEQPKLTFGGKPLEAPALAEKTEDEPHWITYEAIRKRFWLWVRESLGLSDDEVHTALGVESVKDYQGTMAEAKKKIERWIAMQMQDEIPF